MSVVMAECTLIIMLTINQNSNYRHPRIGVGGSCCLSCIVGWDCVSLDGSCAAIVRSAIVHCAALVRYKLILDIIVARFSAFLHFSHTLPDDTLELDQSRIHCVWSGSFGKSDQIRYPMRRAAVVVMFCPIVVRSWY